MIRIHRARPVLETDYERVTLSRDEHRILVTLGMMDNKITPREWLLEAMCEGRSQIPGDNQVLSTKICRLRKKVGVNRLKYIRGGQGYILQGDVVFIGEPAGDERRRGDHTIPVNVFDNYHYRKQKT
jgi:DNA-binding response OmpR family regulator